MLTGTIPQGPGSQPFFRVFMSAGVRHEGTIPASVGRMSTYAAGSRHEGLSVFTAFTFGHGLRGSLPRLTGRRSLMALSLWGNELEKKLEGHLPDLTCGSIAWQSLLLWAAKVWGPRAKTLHGAGGQPLQATSN
eukprot:4746024-Amphidinium_carterae.1